MRIISGKFKGRKIYPPKNLPSRPTTDRLKEGLFNVLQNRFDFTNLKVLDLYSGTGNISYEFASRGSLNITSVEKNRICVEFIKKTSLLFNTKINVIQTDSLNFLKNNNNEFNLIFADPPYKIQYDTYKKIINLSIEKLLIGGILIIEHNRKVDLTIQPNYYMKRRYGDSTISFFNSNIKKKQAYKPDSV